MPRKPSTTGDKTHTGETMGSRRQWLHAATGGFGSLALAALWQELARAAPASDPLAPRAPHFPARAKRVIFIFLNGGPSHLDMFDPKPALQKLHGQPLPASFKKSLGSRGGGRVLGTPFKFEKHGQSGLEISDRLPNLAKLADDLCLVRSMKTEAPDHPPGLLLMNCGHLREMRPSLGAWALYGLGTENQNLPGFVALCPGGTPVKADENWQAAFLPGIYHATFVDTTADSRQYIQDLRNGRIGPAAQLRQMKLVEGLNRARIVRRPGEDLLETRLKAFELAFHMQTEASDAFDLSQEPAHVRQLYGETTHGNQLLLARRLLERGVRFIETFHGDGAPWDTHFENAPRQAGKCKEFDQPIAALLADLKARDMLRDTLVICGGEFGRTPTSELPFTGDGDAAGRDHNRDGFTVLLAGGGVRAGSVVGATDEFGIEAVENPIHVHDLHATVLHLLGLDHTRLTFQHAGRDLRLTDGYGRVAPEILA